MHVNFRIYMFKVSVSTNPAVSIWLPYFPRIDYFFETRFSCKEGSGQGQQEIYIYIYKKKRILIEVPVSALLRLVFEYSWSFCELVYYKVHAQDLN